MKTYETVAEAVNDLSRRGYTYDFRQVTRDHPEWLEDEACLRPAAFVIDELYRFEGPTDPGDETIVFAISSAPHQVKGTLVNAFGAYADSGVANLVAKLPEPQSLPSRQMKAG